MIYLIFKIACSLLFVSHDIVQANCCQNDKKSKRCTEIDKKATDLTLTKIKSQNWTQCDHSYSEKKSEDGTFTAELKLARRE